MSEYLHSVLQFISGLDPLWAPCAFIIFYIIATVCILPGSLITTTAGFLFGALGGFLYASIGFVIGSALTFLLARYLARGWLRLKLENHSRMLAIDRVIGEEGAKFVFLLRLCPFIPFSLLNYGLGITRVKLSQYILASWPGMIPAIALYVYIGSLIQDITSFLGGEREKTSTEWLALLLGLIASVAVSLYITKISRRAIENADKKTTRLTAN